MDHQLCVRSLRSVPYTKQFILASTSIQATSPTVLISQRPRRCAQRKSLKIPSQRRYAHSRRHISTTASIPTEIDTTVAHDGDSSVSLSSSSSSSSSMSCLPLSTLIRSYLITSISSSPVLLHPSLAIMTFLANSKSRVLNPDSNPLLKFLLKRTFYVQFCAGETPMEVRKTIDGLKVMGYQGVILGHAKEAVLSKEEEQQLDASNNAAEQDTLNAEDITAWKENTLRTIELAQRGDFVALKFTGSGREALQRLKSTDPCSSRFKAAVHEICQLAERQGVSLLFDAEQASLQQGIDNWTLYFMKHYNKEKAIVHGTYQAYAKRTPGLLAQHLAEGNKHNFVVGVKLVRGAYLGSDPRHLFWDTIEGTHKCYDNLAKCVMERRYEGLLQPASPEVKEFPRVSMVLASHNANSVATARQLRDQQARMGRERIPLAYGQLMGMADNVSCEIVQEARQRKEIQKTSSEIPQAYKYLVWGTMGECMKYLLRRAHENKDAVSRTMEARQALGLELARRMGFPKR